VSAVNPGRPSPDAPRPAPVSAPAGAPHPAGAAGGIDDRARREWGALTGAQQGALDRAAANLGVSVLQLMEVAGWQVARWVHGLTGGAPTLLLVVAGHGNNGGDGLVAARHLLSWGHRLEVALVADPDRLGEVTGRHLAVLRALHVPIDVVVGGAVGEAAVERADFVVDALLGTGVHGDPRPEQAEAVRRLPPQRTLSVDVPSGLDATSGIPGRPTVRALKTCTLTAMKAGLWTPGGRRHAGEITVADIGMPPAAWAAAGLAQPSRIHGGELLPLPSGLLTEATET
jgi:hydroxyethylthiazole kinase-like uncharacterized protein yjeF